MIIFSNLFIMLLLIGGIVLFQIFLSKTESKIPGLILPILSFGFSFIMLFGILTWVSYDSHTEVSYPNEDESDEIVEFEETEDIEETEGISIFGSEDEELEEDTSIAQGIIGTITIFLCSNIPTGIFLVIYYVTRKDRNKNKHIDHTRIQDL
ncbi:hypothetical protein [Marinilactibacillus psychrotolerans]|uniref:hypothetical protein n=1 Tax=Marinilactibacillus psychrotolerans TaxID=191770 RepID=UPI00388A27C1